MTRFVEELQANDGRYFSVWEFGGDDDVSQYIEREVLRVSKDPGQPPRRLHIRCLFYQVLRALDYLARRLPSGPVVHGDLHVGNIFLDASPRSPSRAVIGDWDSCYRNPTESAAANDAPWAENMYEFGVRVIPCILTCGGSLFRQVSASVIHDAIAGRGSNWRSELREIHDQTKVGAAQRAKLVRDLSFIDGDNASTAAALSALTELIELNSGHMRCPFYEEFRGEQRGDTILGIDLILRIINQGNPSGRLSPEQAMRHPYFDDLDQSCPDAELR